MTTTTTSNTMDEREFPNVPDSVETDEEQRRKRARIVHETMKTDSRGHELHRLTPTARIMAVIKRKPPMKRAKSKCSDYQCNQDATDAEGRCEQHSFETPICHYCRRYIDDHSTKCQYYCMACRYVDPVTFCNDLPASEHNHHCSRFKPVLQEEYKHQITIQVHEAVAAKIAGYNEDLNAIKQEFNTFKTKWHGDYFASQFKDELVGRVQDQQLAFVKNIRAMEKRLEECNERLAVVSVHQHDHPRIVSECEELWQHYHTQLEAERYKIKNLHVDTKDPLQVVPFPSALEEKRQEQQERDATPPNQCFDCKEVLSDKKNMTRHLKTCKGKPTEKPAGRQTNHSKQKKRKSPSSQEKSIMFGAHT